MGVELVKNDNVFQSTEPDLEFVAGGEDIWIPDDIYSAEYAGYEQKFYKNTPKLYLRFKVFTWHLDGFPQDPVLVLPMNLPVDKAGKPLKKISPSSVSYTHLRAHET